MKIIFAANKLWDVYIFRGESIKSLVKDGHTVVVVAPDDGRIDIEKELGVKFINIEVDKRGINPINDLKMMLELLKIYKREKADLIFHYTIKLNIFGSIAGKLSGTDSIAVLTGLGYSFVQTGIISLIAKTLYKISMIFPKEVWVLNEDDKNQLISQGIVLENKIFVLPGEGIDTEKFRPLKREREDSKKVFLMISRAIYDKGFKEYVESAKILKEKYGEKVEFQFLGALEEEGSRAGIDEKEMSKYTSQGIINYLGITNKVENIIKEADCIVLPSYREGISRVLLEASSMEKVVVATNVTGCKEVIKEGETGYLAKVASIESLVNELEKVILHSNKELEIMGQKGRVFVKDSFAQEKINEIYKKKVKKYGA